MKSKHALVMAGAAILLISAVILTAGCTGSPEPTNNITGTWKYSGSDLDIYIEATETSYVGTTDDDDGVIREEYNLTKASSVGYVDEVNKVLMYELGGKLIFEFMDDGSSISLKKYRGEVPQPKPDYSSDPVCGTWSGHYIHKSKSYEVAPQFHPDGTLDIAVDTSLGLQFVHTTWKCAETGTSRKYTTTEGDLVFYLSNDTLYSSSDMSDLWVETGVTAITYKRVN